MIEKYPSNVKHQPPKPCQVNLAVLTYNCLDDTIRFLNSIKQHTKVPHNVFVLDNASKDETPAWLQSQNQENLFYCLSTENWGVPGGRNRLIEFMSPHVPEDGFFIFCDNDLEFTGIWAELYLSFFHEHPQAGMAAAHGHCIRIAGKERRLYPHPRETAPVDVVSGGFVCWCRKKAVEDIGPFDENLGLFWHEDDDYSVRALARGWGVYALPHTPVLHHEHKSGAAEAGLDEGGSPRNQAYLIEKWQKQNWIDSTGHIVRKKVPSVDTSTRKISEELTLLGFSANKGGYRWLAKEASVELAPASMPRQFVLEVEAALGRNYNQFPFRTNIFVNDSFIGAAEFTEDDSRQPFAIGIPPTKDPVKITLQSDGAFSPAFSGSHFWEQSPFSLRATDPQILPCPDGNFALPSSKDFCPEEGEADVLWEGPFIDFGEFSAMNQSAFVSCLPLGKNLAARDNSHYLFALYDLHKRGLETRIWSIAVTNTLPPKTAIFSKSPLAAAKPSYFADCQEKLSSLNRTIGITTAETSALSPSWVKSCDTLSELWVTNQFHRRMYAEAGIASEKLFTMPVGINTDLFSSVHATRGNSETRENFCFFTIGALTGDNDWQTLFDAYFTAFGKNDPVVLLLLINEYPVYMSSIDALVEQAVKNTGRAKDDVPYIETDAAVQSLLKLAPIFADSDCYVHSSRFLETPLYALRAMAAETPAICPNIEPFNEFIPAEASYLVNASLEKATLPFPGQVPEDSKWAKVHVADLAAAMREAYENKSQYQEKKALARKHVLEHFSPATTKNWIAERLAAIPPTVKAKEKKEPQAFSALTPPSETKIVLTEEPLVKDSPACQASDEQALRIGIDVRSMRYEEIASRGIGQFLLNHLRALVHIAPNFEYTLLGDTESPEEIFLHFLEHDQVTWCHYDRLKGDTLDLIHIPDPMSMLALYDSPFRLLPKGVKSSILFHDLIPLARREEHYDAWGPDIRLCYNNRLLQLERSGCLVLTNSQATRRDLLQAIKIPPERVIPVMAGINQHDEMQHLGSAAQVNALQKFQLEPHKFFLVVGALDPHKDPITSFEAFFMAQQAVPGVKLAVVGSFNDPYKEKFKAVCERDNVNGVVFTGFTSREELTALYQSACGLVFPSKYEGFGFPVLEAMAYGCPVITTTASSLPEVAGNAALLIEPGDKQKCAEYLVQLAQDPNLRETLAQKGKSQAKKFSWERTAQKTISAWLTLFGGKTPEKPGKQEETTISQISSLLL